MPRKRASREVRETPQERHWRMLRIEELEASLTRLGPIDERVAAKDDARFDRWWAMGREIWDRLSPVAREHEAAKVLADLRRYDKQATLAADGGREVFALHYAVDRERRRWEKQKATHPIATPVFAEPLREGATRRPVRPADEPGAPPAAPARPKPRPRLKAGVVWERMDHQRYDYD